MTAKRLQLGTHTLSSNGLIWTGFNGVVVIQGNSGESGLHTNQAVHVDGSAISAVVTKAT